MKTVGRYELVRALGGAGERVWEAELVGPAGFRKRVAVRLLSTDGDPLDAVRGAGMLHHPNLVEVYEVDAHEGRWFCAMEYVRGGRLLDYAPLPPRAVIDAGVQICAGLAARRGLGGSEPRLLDPSDVLVDEGVVKLGVVARAAPPGASWRPPESGDQDRSDVWSVGAVLHQLVTGDRDVDATGVALFGEVLTRCLARDPDQRYATVEDLAAALDGLEAVGPGLMDVASGAATPVSPGQWPTGPRTNLERAGPLVGRADLLRELAGRVAAGRLITLKGPPGVGKSHLAQALARQRLDAGTAEAWWIRPRRGDLATSVASELGLIATDPTGVGLALADRGDVLLVIDPIEGHLDEVGVLASWLGAAPALRIVVPSREPLRVPGEQIVEIGALDAGSAAVLLSEVAGVEPAEVAALAARVDGLPAALVFLGHQVAVAGLADVLAGPAAEEASTMGALGEALVEIGIGLAGWERVALCQLSALPGDFTLDEAEGVVDVADDADAPWSLDVVAALVDRSLVSPVAASGTPRFRMLSPIRAWAAGLLGE